MKVLVFTTLFPNHIEPNYAIFIKERMFNFANINGCEIKVIAPVPYFPPIKLNKRWYQFSQVKKKEKLENFKIYHPRYFITPKLGMPLYGLFLFLSVLYKVRNIQKDFDFDLIDAHYVYPDGFAAVLLGKFLKKPVVISARGTDINLYTKFPLINKLISYTLRKANSVISVSQALKVKMMELGIEEDKISVIPNGVDPKKFFPIKKNDARKKLCLPFEKKIILSVGNLIPAKGFELLIDAFRILKEEYKENNLYLVIVGDGNFRKQLEERINILRLDSEIKLAGAVSHNRLSLWYNASDLFCLASEREGWPNVIIESLACGTPVVSTKVGGIPEILRSDKLGILVERDSNEIAKGILRGLKKKWDYSHIVEYAQENTWHNVSKRVFNEFTKVINS